MPIVRYILLISAVQIFHQTRFSIQPKNFKILHVLKIGVSARPEKFLKWRLPARCISLAELEVAANDFSLENKPGAGSFGVVYRGKLTDGRDVAIKRCAIGPNMKKFQDKESAFDSELAFMSRLHHKHLVMLLGYCEEKDERLLVYEFMKNGALFDHLHNKNGVENSSVLNSWKKRIKIALNAARGIEYLHNYAVPPIIHRDINSSNFGLSLVGSRI